MTNSPVPTTAPKVQPTEEVAGEASEKRIAALSESKQWKDINEYLEGKKEYYRHFLPGGTEMKALVEVRPDEFIIAAKVASTIVSEFEALQSQVAMVADAVKKK